MPPYLFDKRVFDDNWRDILRIWPRKPRIRILIVADTSVSYTSDFGIGQVAQLIRATDTGYATFEVDLARLGDDPTVGSTVNPAPGPTEERYPTFRFTHGVDGVPIIDGYDELWLFGFAPGNDGSPDDVPIDTSPYRLTDDEVAAVTRFMNVRKGGVLAMGDHHYLGAALCSRIPRVRSMRRWTNADGAPPIGGEDRVDTNRPMNALQDASVDPTPDTIPDAAQMDAVPQPLEVRMWSVPSLFVFERRSRPHPILCGGALGRLDVYPDHPHEGIVREDHEIDLAADYAFSGVAGQEYPTVGVVQPWPQVIAWGNTLPDPPYDQAKGDSPAKRFGVLGAYDGHPVSVGRVVVDSTWHHWMDMNLVGLQTAGGTRWDKVLQVFRNIAVWLARPALQESMLGYTTWWLATSIWTIEDLSEHRSSLEIGTRALDVLGRGTSDCLVRQWLWDRLPVELQPWWRWRKPDPGPLLVGLPIDLLEAEVLGNVLKSQMALRPKLLSLAREEPKAGAAEKAVLAAMEEGVAHGLAAFAGHLETASRMLGAAQEASAKLGRARAKAEV